MDRRQGNGRRTADMTRSQMQLELYEARGEVAALQAKVARCEAIIRALATQVVALEATDEQD